MPRKNEAKPRSAITHEVEIVKHENVRAAIAAATAEIREVQKTGQNDFHRYSYASDADIMRAVRTAMAHHGIVVTVEEVADRQTEVRKGERGRDAMYVFACYRWRVAHAGGDDSILVPVYGAGQDSGEKADYKALTGAKKYLYLQLFALASSDDPERDDRKPVEVDEAEVERKVREALREESTRREKYIERIGGYITERAAMDPSTFFKREVKFLAQLSLAQLEKYGAYLKGCPTNAQIARWEEQLQERVITDADAAAALKRRYGKERAYDLTHDELEAAIGLASSDNTFFQA